MMSSYRFSYDPRHMVKDASPLPFVSPEKNGGGGRATSSLIGARLLSSR